MPDEWAEMLGDPRPVVRDRAVQELAKKAGAAVNALQKVLLAGSESGHASSKSADSHPSHSDSKTARAQESGSAHRSPQRGGQSGRDAIEARRNAVWALTRIEEAGARKAVREALEKFRKNNK